MQNFKLVLIKLLFILQVVDFLSGKAPLNLTMRLGDHMMLIQLQLSTVNSSSNSKRSRTSTNQTSSSGASISRPPTSVSSASSTSTSSSTPSAAQTTSMPSGGGPGPTQTSDKPEAESYKPKLDTRALTEASKNLTKTLRQLSSEVLTTKCEEVSYQFKIKLGSGYSKILQLSF